MPVIPPRHPTLLVEALLNDGPLSASGQNETVQINLETVGDGVVVDTRSQTARSDQRPAVQSASIGDCQKLLRSVARKPAAATANEDAEFIRTWRQTALKRANDRCRDSG